MAQQTNIGNNSIAQIAIVVRDIEQAAKRWADLFGTEVPTPITTQPGLSVHQTYRGKPSDAQAKLAFLNLGNIQIELIQPLGGDSSWQQVLDEKGEGVHHIGIWVENAAASQGFLSERGVEVLHRGDMGDGQYVYFDTAEKYGVMIELLENRRTPIEV
ncbi:MAG: VOC family protein [Fimbriimonadaceae bacterium]